MLVSLSESLLEVTESLKALTVVEYLLLLLAFNSMLKESKNPSIEGSVFSVNEQSGVPSLEIFTDGTVRITESTGNVLIGTDIDNGLDKVQIDGDLSADRVIADLQGDVFGQDSTKLVDSTYGEFNGFVNGQVSSIDNHTTDDLDEGDDNLYFTKQRARRQARIMALIFGSC